jgi:hypothetical protein
METKTDQPTRVITGVVRLSYAHLFSPKAVDDGDEKKYSTAILIPKTDKATIKAILAAQDAAAQAGKTSTFGGKIPANLKLPLRDGDEEKADDEAYAGHYFLNCSCKRKPGIVDRAKKEITDEDEVYSGCYARVSLNFFAFKTKGNVGVGAGLNNVMKWADGEAFSGVKSAAEDFGAIGDEEDDF